jgi:hypothetical protein
MMPATRCHIVVNTARPPRIAGTAFRTASAEALNLL